MHVQASLHLHENIPDPPRIAFAHCAPYEFHAEQGGSLKLRHACLAPDWYRRSSGAAGHRWPQRQAGQVQGQGVRMLK